MQTERDDIDKQQLLLALEAAYGLALRSIVFTPKGEEAYTYIARTADDTLYFVRLQPADKARDLERLYPLLVDLQRQGLDHALAPLATCAGSFTVIFAGELVAVFPFVDGVTLWQREATLDDIGAAVSIIARLHGLSVPEQLPRERFDNPFAQPIRRALELALSARRVSSPLQQAACRLLAAHHGDIRRTLTYFEQLGRQARRQVRAWVPTHGDPNMDNFLEDRDGRLYLTDWGELAAGPPERDLWHFSDKAFDLALRRYASECPLETLNLDAFTFYAYRWSLQEIADYATRLLFGRLGAVEDEHAWAELQAYVPIRHAEIAESVQQIRKVVALILGGRTT